jgi:hypothetical protein
VVQELGTLGDIQIAEKPKVRVAILPGASPASATQPEGEPLAFTMILDMLCTLVHHIVTLEPNLDANKHYQAIAKKVMPFNPLPKSPEEAERQQTEQVDKVSGRMAERIQPILSEMARDQNLTRDSINRYSERVSEQIGSVLTAELAKNQQLNNNLQQTQAVAQDALKLSHEITALYLSSFKDQGIITRLLSLPANVVKDAASLSIVSSSDRKKVEETLVSKMAEIDRKLSALQAAAPAAPTPAPAGPPLSAPTRPAKP